MFPSYMLVKNVHGKFYYPEVRKPGDNKIYWDEPQKTATLALEFAKEKIAELEEKPQEEITESESPSEDIKSLAECYVKAGKLIES